MFSIILNVIGSLLHLYVASRLYKIGPIRDRVTPRTWWLGAAAIWLLYLFGMHLGDESLDWRWWPGQFSMLWLGIQFVMALCLLVADLATGFGLWWRNLAPRLIAVGAAIGVFLSGFAIYQATRAPAVVEHEMVLKDLPATLDGMVLVAMTDLHLGAQRRSAWMQERVEQVNAIAPAAVLMVGDQVEDNPVGDAKLAAVLRGFKAPLGVWAVTGNHEFYGAVDTTVAEFEAGGVRWLRDKKVELAPGLVLAGLEDIGSTMHGEGNYMSGLDQLLPARPTSTATILMAHIPAPALVDNAAAKGVDLMLSGHTHGGQIWPFGYLVKRDFPLLVGAHKIADMKLVISRGAGSWGPRMRLWQPGEILKLTLRSAEPAGRGVSRVAAVQGQPR